MQDRCNLLPDFSAVYILVSHDFFDYQKIEVMYVGMTTSVRSRLKYPHPIEKRYGSHLSCYVMKTQEHSTLEVDFIKRYKPVFNKAHNG